jgi:DNA primase
MIRRRMTVCALAHQHVGEGRAIAEYDEHLTPWLLPRIKDQPLNLFRCPDGWQKQCSFQKHADASWNAAAS